MMAALPKPKTSKAKGTHPDGYDCVVSFSRQRHCASFMRDAGKKKKKRKN